MIEENENEIEEATYEENSKMCEELVDKMMGLVLQLPNKFEKGEMLMNCAANFAATVSLSVADNITSKNENTPLEYYSGLVEAVKKDIFASASHAIKLNLDFKATEDVKH